MTIDIDRKLLEEAMRLTGLDKNAVINYALEYELQQFKNKAQLPEE